jgi:3-oxoadipate enol-lactonase
VTETMSSWIERQVNRAIGAAGRLPALTTSVSIAHQVAIRTEQFVRRPRTRHPARTPAIHWHEGGEGPALLLINGLTGSGILWPTEFVKELERSFHVIRLDNRGTGWSRNAPMPFTVATMAEDAYDVLRACGHERAVVAGISMGGVVAQELALRHPSVVEHLVLMATIPPPPANTAPPEVGSLLHLVAGPAQDDREHDPAYRAEVAQGLLRFASPTFVASPELEQELGGQVLRRMTTRRGAIAQSRAVIAWRGPKRIRSITVPTTIIMGTDDPLVPLANGGALAELIPGSRCVELPDCGHLIPWEKPDSVLAELHQPHGHTASGRLA